MTAPKPTLAETGVLRAFLDNGRPLYFLAMVFEATHAGVLEWADSPSGTLVAPLADDYTVELSEVPDFETGDYGSPDYVLHLMKDGHTVFALDRRIVEVADLAIALRRDQLDYSHPVFSELWRRATLKASKVTEHLDAVNRALAERLQNH